jgi:HAD superfamily hydrolase (TIGR01509 family)
MIKAVIFDLDGVLVDTKKIHYEALNKAIKSIGSDYQISLEDHLKIFDGLTTKKKLQILNKKKIINKSFNKKIVAKKNFYTKILLKKNLKYNSTIFKIIEKLSKKYKIAIATNAIKDTLDICLKKLKIKKFIHFKLSNEDIKNPKPNPEIYLKIFIKFGLLPKEALILEDSYFGRSAAKSSGAALMGIKNINKDVTYSNITQMIKKINNSNKMNKNFRWEDEKLNILIPMAGEGRRFKDAGFIFPKPIIEINSKPMIQWVIESLNIKAQYIFIVQKKHASKYNLESVLKMLEPNCRIIQLDKKTEGAASTTLLAEKYINNSNPLIIANSDQYIEWNSGKTMYNFISKKIDGGILIFNSIHPKWSYVEIDKNNIAKKVAEKKVISNNATVGVYYWAKGRDYCNYAKQMIKKNIRVNNEFYVCPVFNEAIEAGKKIFVQKVDKMWGLGTPEDLNQFNLMHKNK